MQRRAEERIANQPPLTAEEESDELARAHGFVPGTSNETCIVPGSAEDIALRGSYNELVSAGLRPVFVGGERAEDGRLIPFCELTKHLRLEDAQSELAVTIAYPTKMNNMRAVESLFESLLKHAGRDTAVCSLLKMVDDGALKCLKAAIDHGHLEKDFFYHYFGNFCLMLHWCYRPKGEQATWGNLRDSRIVDFLILNLGQAQDKWGDIIDKMMQTAKNLSPQLVEGIAQLIVDYHRATPVEHWSMGLIENALYNEAFSEFLASYNDVGASVQVLRDASDYMKRAVRYKKSPFTGQGIYPDKIIPGTAKPAHNNDFANWRAIKTIPTVEELQTFFTNPGFLPSVQDSLRIPGHTREEAYLEAMYRALRADMLHEAWSNLVIPLNLKGSKEYKLESAQPATVFDNLKYMGINRKVKQRDHFRIFGLRFASMSRFGYADTKEAYNKFVDRVEANERYPYQHKQLAILRLDGQPLIVGQLQRDYHSLCNETSTHPIMIFGIENGLQIEMALRRVLPILRGTSVSQPIIEIVALNAEIYGTEPILQTLQQIHEVPFAKELLFGGSESEQVLSPTPKVPLTPEVKRIVDVLNDDSLDMGKYIGVDQQFAIDPVQSAAIIHAFTEPVTIIQGPPGK